MPSDLSGGMRKRVALARAIALGPGGDPVRRADDGPRPDHREHDQSPDPEPAEAAGRHVDRRHPRHPFGVHGRGPDRVPARGAHPLPRHDGRSAERRRSRSCAIFFRGEAMPRTSSREATVGAFLALALIVLAVGIMAVGGESRLFSRKASYRVVFPSTDGLIVGSPVKMGGVQVGSVTELRLPTDPGRAGRRAVVGRAAKLRLARAARLRGVAEVPPVPLRREVRPADPGRPQPGRDSGRRADPVLEGQPSVRAERGHRRQPERDHDLAEGDPGAAAERARGSWERSSRIRSSARKGWPRSRRRSTTSGRSRSASRTGAGPWDGSSPTTRWPRAWTISERGRQGPLGDHGRRSAGARARSDR